MGGEDRWCGRKGWGLREAPPRGWGGRTTTDTTTAGAGGTPTRVGRTHRTQWVGRRVEPAAAMSHGGERRTADLIREINKTKSLIVVEHDMQFIRAIARRVTVFHQGRILVEDDVEQVMRNQQVRDVYLGKGARK